jgi:hypothetical protein
MHRQHICGLALSASLLCHAAQAQLNGPFIAAEQARLFGSDATGSDLFGTAIDVDGATAVMGNPYDASPGLNQAGSAYVFVRSGATWLEQQKVVSADLASNDAFGGAVAIDGDTLVVGARYASLGGVGIAGAAYVFVRNGAVWTQQQKLAASDAALFDGFGNSVAVSGDTILVAAFGEDPSNLLQAGSAYVFVRSGGVWSQQAKIFASDAAAFEQFGQFVALHGDTALIGTPFDNHPGLSTAGSAYVFTRSGATWSQQQKLVAFDSAAGDWFGYGVDLHGDTALVGAPRDDHGGFDNAGSAYVYARSGAAWSLQQKITSPAPGGGQNLGGRLALSNGIALLAQSSVDSIDGADPGAVFAYSRSGSTWSFETTLWPADAADGDEFGSTVALDGTTAFVGSYYTPSFGAGYVFELQTGHALYCTAKTNSQGCTPTLGASGSPSATNPNPFVLSAGAVLNQKSGLLFYGFAPTNAPFQGGYLCVEPPTVRTAVQSSGGSAPPDDCSGSYSYDFNAHIQSGVDPLLTVGRDVFAQFWSRDPASSTVHTGLTSAAHFAVQP